MNHEDIKLAKRELKAHSQIDSMFGEMCGEILEYIATLEERIAIMSEGGWHDASKRPPKEGRYLVWGLHEFIPDHCDMPNAYWQTRIAQWSNITGWDTKVKYWQELPEPPKDGE